MLNSILANFYERDLRRFIDEVNLFKSEDDLWKTQGAVKNSAGNLALLAHLNYHLGQVNYLRRVLEAQGI
ncbi:MAG TPA: hypothetical protein VHD83_21235 [Puia sp.]|nr:hypothetical protein [Puia sp.]